ncbi:MAG: hypothetical protein WBX15_00830 [Thermoanaerobaculia bacterium]
MSKLEIESSSNAARTPKRVALVRREVPARLLEDRDEVVTTAPHLLLREIILIEVIVIALAIISLLVNAPLEGIADPYHTPNPAKAAWYFLGLQELLHYFPPIVAGILIPTCVVFALVIIPFFRVNVDLIGLYERPWKMPLVLISIVTAALVAVLALKQVWPVVVPTVAIYLLMLLPAIPTLPSRVRSVLGHIPLADWIMTWFVVVAVVLTLIGVLFRGPGWSWVWPWQGVY